MSDAQVNKLDEFGATLRDLFNRATVEGKRTVVLTRLRMEMSGLDRQRKELFSSLGDKVNDLRLNGKIIDTGLMGLLQSDFEDIDRMTMKISDTMDSIQRVSLEYAESSETKGPPPEEPLKGTGGLLDSFQVL
jgi:hypothetical protein